MIQIIPNSQNLTIHYNNGANQDAIIGFIVYTGKELKEIDYQADDNFYVQPLTTLDCMEYVQAIFGGDAYITLNEDLAHF